MGIDWSKVGESGMLVVPTAFVGAYIGARIKEYLDRARPDVSVTACRYAVDHDLLSFSFNVSPELTQQLRESPWAKTIVGKTNAAKVYLEIESHANRHRKARDTVEVVEQKLKQLPSMHNASVSAKIAFLDEISRDDVYLINAVLTGCLARQEVNLPEISDEELGNAVQITEYKENDEDEGGYLIYLKRRWWPFTQGDKKTTELLLPGVKALCCFHIPSIKCLLEHAREQLTKLAMEGETLARSLSNELKTVQPLMVEVSIVNKGRSSVMFSPWAILKILNEGRGGPIVIKLKRAHPIWCPEDPLVALKQREALKNLEEIPLEESKFFSVEGGAAAKFKYVSIDPVAQLETNFPNLATILSMDLFRCQVIVRRADVESTQRAWITSSVGLFGNCEEQFPEAELAIASKAP